MDASLKLFIWDGPGVLKDYTSGMIVALAHDLEEALRLIERDDDAALGRFDVLSYRVVEKPGAFTCWGGG